jgi:hypothetical protein
MVIFPRPVQHRITVQVVEIEQTSDEVDAISVPLILEAAMWNAKELQYHLDVLKHLIS